jgi:soluble P-type ATPase
LVEERLRKVKAEISYLEEGETSQRKLDLLRDLGAMRCVAIGNGVDDAPMIQEAGLGICILGKEGASSAVCSLRRLLRPSIHDSGVYPKY